MGKANYLIEIVRVDQKTLSLFLQFSASCDLAICLGATRTRVRGVGPIIRFATLITNRESETSAEIGIL